MLVENLNAENLTMQNVKDLMDICTGLMSHQTYKYLKDYFQEGSLENTKSSIDIKDKKLLTMEEATMVLNIGKNNLYKLVKKGTIPVVMGSGKNLVIAGKLDKWLEQNEGKFIF